MKIDSLDNIQIPYNWVLIKPGKGTHQLVLNKGTDHEKILYLDVSFEQQKHAPISGEVVAVPDKLIFNKKREGSMAYKTDMDLKVGDTVFYNYLAAMNAYADNQQRYVEVDDEIFIFVTYNNIYAGKRKIDEVSEETQYFEDEGQKYQVVMCNGFCLVEPKKKESSSSIIIPSELFATHSEHYGTVRFVGKPVTEWINHAEVWVPDSRPLQPGDDVIMTRVCDIPLEYDIHSSFNGKQKYFRVEQRHITCLSD